MHRQKHKLRGALVAVAMAAVLTAVMSASALAHTGEFERFDYCPSTTSGVNKCVYSVTTGGSIVLGKKTTPIVNPVTLQGGFSKENLTTTISSFFGATNEVTLSKTPQPVPGGLAGLVNCTEISNLLARAACELVFENGLTGVDATLELARPASEIELSEFNLIYEEDALALKLPVMVHLENPLLGSSCYVGSSSSPIIWNLTTGTTSPPAPYASISGFSGTGSLKENGEIAELAGSILVDNTWAAPEASGCGGVFSAAIDPLINLTVGLPAGAGENSAKLINNIYDATAVSVNDH